MGKDKRIELTDKLAKHAENVLNGRSKDVNYQGRPNGYIRNSSEIVGNDLVARKAIAKFFGLKK